MKKSELKKLIKEEMEREDPFDKVISYLRTKVYPKLDEDELYDLNTKLKEWFNKNVL